MENSTFTILLGGRLIITDRVRSAVANTRVVAADGGMRHADALGLVPQLWVGDFDSAEAGLRERYAHVERQDYPAAKAQTDGEIAVMEAISRGATGFILVGAFGGDRSDHALHHVLQGTGLAERGYRVMMTSGDEEAYPLLPGETSIDLPPGSLFSILAFSSLDGLGVSGARYALGDSMVPFGSSQTLSNIAEGPVTFQLKRGRAIILARPQDFSGA